MYWSVGTSQDGIGAKDGVANQCDAEEMGSKQSFPGTATLTESLTVENIQAAYQNGDMNKAQNLIQVCCSETEGAPLDKHHLLGVAAANGDVVSVQYLLTEVKVELSQELTDDNPAVVAAYYGHKDIIKMLLNSVAGPCLNRDLVNWMMTVACQQGQLEIVKLLVHSYHADPESCAVRKNDFAIITGLPLYVAAQAGNEEISEFLLHNGAAISSYTLMDHPEFTEKLLKTKFVEPSCPDPDTDCSNTLTVQWSHLKLPWLELNWFLDISSRISVLDLSANCLQTLPSIIPWGLIQLQTLNLSDNHLKELPAIQSSDQIICTSLLQIDLSRNQLSSLPPGFLHLTSLQKLTASKNQLVNLFEVENGVNWIGLRKLEELDVSDNLLTELPSVFTHCFKSLSYLNVSRNKLKAFPVPWACPLKSCKISSNFIEDIPNSLTVFWKNYLRDLDISNNCLKSVPACVFQLEVLASLKVSGNQLSSLPPPDIWTCSRMKLLDLSKNHFGKTDKGSKLPRLSFFTTLRRSSDPAYSLYLPEFLCESLEILFLCDNQLEAVPPSVCGLKNLSELYLSNNPGIRELPCELGQLSNLWQLDIEDLNIGNVPAEVRKKGAAATLGFLRAQLRRAEKCKLMKLIIVGPPRQGKSTLLEALQSGKVPQAMQKEATISICTWELERPSGIKSVVDSVEFSVWDIGGPASMSTVNQCFFTDKALYVVVWNLAMGEEAVANLQSWLLNIEARAPNAAVLVVGTHLDLIDTKFRTERIATLRAYVLALCRSPSGSRATGYPDITCKHLHEVSCKTLEGLDNLRRLIFQASCCVKDMSNTSGSYRFVGRLIPRSYFLLQDAVTAEKQRRKEEDEVQYLTDLELEQIIEKNPESDIKDYEDLQSAMNFLIETGVLLHFPDTSRGLRNLYFLDAVWLSECLERIINIKSSKSVAKNGVIKGEDLRMLLVGTGFTEQTEEQYLQLLAKFEIALPVASNSYLLPHLLPPKPGLDIHGLRQKIANTIQRLFKMSFVPAGFWQRFIARMLISLTEMDLQSFESKKNAKTLRERKTVIYSFAGTQQRNRCSTFRVRRSQTIYWKEGLLVTFSGGYLSIESSELNWKKKKSGGIKIICQSEARDFSAMAFITDHVNSLIDQWFPALRASENDGTLLIEQYAPCPYCAVAIKDGGEVTSKSKAIHYFNMEDCVLAAVEMDHIICPNHPSVPVFLQELVPELFMTDFPARLFLDNSKMEYSESENSILGQGGSGTVIYKAKYRDLPVAVKRFHFKKCKQKTSDINTDSMVKHLQSMEALRNFSEFRQEASMLHSLQHPCIVSLIGISIHPLCFALELAPLSSLNTVLEENSKGESFIPLGHMLTFKMTYQIAAGLAYLHRKNVIFCDLKSDNILVWSLEVTDSVIVKLSDYGISRQSFHEGALGVEGTPGYQAPEIRPGIVYDEKVDMFSYGMVVYELLSGRRPILDQHQPQIVKKLSKGVRPILGTPEEVQFHFLHALMLECWDTKPEKRPLANSVVKQMQDPSFPALKYLLHCEKHSYLFFPAEQDHTVMFWDMEGEERKYTVVNIEKGVEEVKKMPCSGMKLSCQLKIANTLWTATEDQNIYIYSLKEMCPLRTAQKTLTCPAVVTCMLLVPAKSETLPILFVGMADGLIAVYTLIADMPHENESYLCSHTINKSLFKIPDDDPRQNPYPITVMVLVKSCSELWCSNGPGILVIDCLNLQAVRRLDPYSFPSRILSMTSNSAFGGEEAVWCLDDKTNTLLMYHVASFQLCAKYFCGDCNPLRDMFTIQTPAAVAPQISKPTMSENLVSDPSSPMDVSIIYSKEVGTQIIRNQDSLTDYCSLSSMSSSDLSQSSCTNGIFDSLERSSSVTNSGSIEEVDVSHTLAFGTVVSEGEHPNQASESTEGLQSVKVLAVKDTLWIPRQKGDIIVIELENEVGTHRGRVIALLRAADMVKYGMLLDAAVIEKDTVVCGFQNENKEWCLAVWRGWGARDFEIFYQSYEEVGRLDTSMRKRR
ncbi:leucine-rich repeat serine/threonine-protein kinase 1 [Polypterus senegalus]|uniref:leucine-rich repeat serine/threonine-protein kinase 1 n=1 Tax=Polypterus senegalus TaxID=55291 RepID=UPI0019627BB8|nr:leucine-rich repeat serine/threonine-protein kinase 1 [Polypterus senegalus]XP_039628635.1 leucine-rich repeat serine/threonine-protein kinase 1 [Polypterus senegalus]